MDTFPPTGGIVRIIQFQFRHFYHFCHFCFAVVVASHSAFAEEQPPAQQTNWAERIFSNTGPLGLNLHAETGFIGLVSHKIQLGNSGSDIDYLRDGGQNTLFPFSRFSADVLLFKRNIFTLLYQPLELSTSQLASSAINVNGATFPANTRVDYLYGFSFWRISYLYNFFWDSPGQELAIGASLQIRNARITFSSADGTVFRSTEDIGPVPILKVRARYTFDNKMWLGTEIDGFYAGTPGFNGSANQFIGAILDASVRAGMQVTPMFDAFVNIRTILGGAVGTERNPVAPADGYTRNWIYTGTLTLGATLKFPGV